MSGLELCWETRLLASQGRPLYILMTSSTYDQGHLVEALDGGADDFISKPPLAEELYARLRAAERLVSLQRELVRMATTDPLTGLFNRRAFFERASGACRRAARDKAVSAILMDIDHFKRVNDTYGHDTGDEAIRVCAHTLPKNAIVGRLGGDEFAIVLERCSLSKAIEAAKELKLRLAERRIETSTEPIALTCSVGVSEAEPGDTIDQLLRCADIALYDAKVGGRDRVVGAHASLLKARCSNTPKNIVRASDR
jgi:diguanylate cyclase (GGDEF)-like protein